MKIKYLRNHDGIVKWIRKQPELCWADLVLWQVNEGHITMEDIGHCRLCDYCGKVNFHEEAINSLLTVGVKQ